MVELAGYDPTKGDYKSPILPIKLQLHMVGIVELESTRLTALEPRSSASANFAIPPCGWAGWIRTNGMHEPKSCALPLGDNPISENLTLYCMYKYVFTLHIYKSELFNH